MLKATIIYLPGTGGHMLYKTLTLSEKTITGTNCADLEEYKKKLSAQEKFNRYVVWDANNWKKEEAKDFLSYRRGKVDFHHYEQSDLWLIDYWHPVEFAQMLTSNNLLGDNFYQHVIFIDVDFDHQEFLSKNQETKNYTLNFVSELTQLRQLQNQFRDISCTVSFSNFLNQVSYKQDIEKLNHQLSLGLDMNLVEQLWQAWSRESNLVWHH